MEPKHFLILGGYGSTGLPIAQHLLTQTDVTITLAGRNIVKANQAATKLNKAHKGEPVSGTYADASDSQSLHKAFEGIDMVVVPGPYCRAPSIFPRYAENGRGSSCYRKRSVRLRTTSAEDEYPGRPESPRTGTGAFKFGARFSVYWEASPFQMEG